MQWTKKGLVYCPDGTSNWARNSALTPTPYLISPDVIRVYCGFRDDSGVSRIGYVDVESDNPTKVIGVSQTPVLDIGVPGAFDDNGMLLGDLIQVGNELRLYYVGFQLGTKAKFLAFTGLAVSTDNGNSFVRYSQAPIMDRSSNGLYINAIHSIHRENGKYRVWYARGNGWEIINGKPYPQYDIWTTDSDDGITFTGKRSECIACAGDEYRIGRPRVFWHQGKRYMHYTYGTVSGKYHAGLAVSDDGISWTRIDDQLGIATSPTGWDSIHLSYLALLPCRDKLYMFYNGNNMGIEGFGVAELSG